MILAGRHFGAAFPFDLTLVEHTSLKLRAPYEQDTRFQGDPGGDPALDEMQCFIWLFSPLPASAPTRNPRIT